mgnify:FL=1
MPLGLIDVFAVFVFISFRSCQTEIGNRYSAFQVSDFRISTYISN